MLNNNEEEIINWIDTITTILETQNILEFFTAGPLNPENLRKSKVVLLYYVEWIS